MKVKRKEDSNVNAMFTKEIFKRIIPVLEEFNATLYSPHLCGSFERFPEFNDKPEFGAIIHEFYTKSDWAIFVEPSDETYGFTVTRDFIKKSSGYPRDAINYYLSVLANKFYAITLTEQNSKIEKPTTLMLIFENKSLSKRVLDIMVDYISQSKARIKDCEVDIIGKDM